MGVGWLLGFALGVWVGALSLAWKLKRDQRLARERAEYDAQFTVMAGTFGEQKT